MVTCLLDTAPFLGAVSSPEMLDLEAEVLTVKSAYVYRVGQLPMIHKDPFDRLLLRAGGD